MIVWSGPIADGMQPWEAQDCHRPELDKDDAYGHRQRRNPRQWKQQVVLFCDANGIVKRLPPNQHIPFVLGHCALGLEVINKYTGDTLQLSFDTDNPRIEEVIHAAMETARGFLPEPAMVPPWEAAPEHDRRMVQVLNALLGRPPNDESSCVLAPGDVQALHRCIAEVEQKCDAELSATETHRRLIATIKRRYAKRKTCACCGQMGWKLPKCGGCKQVAYCSRECQEAHWPSHRQDCARR